MRYDYYEVNVPSDYSDDPEERATLAVRLADEKTRIWARPCEWTILDDDGETVKVRRMRR